MGPEKPAPTMARSYFVSGIVPIALGTAAEAVRRHPGAFDEIRFVLFSTPDFEVYRQALNTLDDV